MSLGRCSGRPRPETPYKSEQFIITICLIPILSYRVCLIELETWFSLWLSKYSFSCRVIHAVFLNSLKLEKTSSIKSQLPCFLTLDVDITTPQVLTTTQVKQKIVLWHCGGTPDLCLILMTKSLQLAARLACQSRMNGADFKTKSNPGIIKYAHSVRNNVIIFHQVWNKTHYRKIIKNRVESYDLWSIWMFSLPWSAITDVIAAFCIMCPKKPPWKLEPLDCEDVRKPKIIALSQMVSKPWHWRLL